MEDMKMEKMKIYYIKRQIFSVDFLLNDTQMVQNNKSKHQFKIVLQRKKLGLIDVLR